MRKYDEASVVRILKKNKGVRVNSNNVIEVLTTSPAVGIGTWGKIDYLVNYCGYVVTFSNNILYTHGNKEDKDDSAEKENTKAVKRAAKLNMAAMAKASMRRVKSK